VSDLATIRGLLKARLQTAIPGLNVEDLAPDAVTAPAAIITPAPGTFIDYETSAVSDDYRFTVTLLVDRRDERTAQLELDAYLARSGAQSIYAALSGQALAGSHFVEVMSAADYQGYTYANMPYLGCRFVVQVGA
jgi:hypothetical protein